MVVDIIQTKFRARLQSNGIWVNQGELVQSKWQLLRCEHRPTSVHTIAVCESWPCPCGLLAAHSQTYNDICAKPLQIILKTEEHVQIIFIFCWIPHVCDLWFFFFLPPLNNPLLQSLQQLQYEGICSSWHFFLILDVEVRPKVATGFDHLRVRQICRPTRTSWGIFRTKEHDIADLINAMIWVMTSGLM